MALWDATNLLINFVDLCNLVLLHLALNIYIYTILFHSAAEHLHFRI
jgi:predicted kinase